MASTWRLLDWEKQAMVDAYAGGEKVESIAAEFGVAPNYPTMLARRRGIPPRQTGRPLKTSHPQKPVLLVQT